MARVALISLYDRLPIGPGILSAYLRANGHEPYVIHFKDYRVVKCKHLKGYRKGEHHVMSLNSGNEVIMSYAEPPEEHEVELLKRTVEQVHPDLIGVSFRTIARKTAFRICKALRTADADRAPLILGGIAPTIEPDECLSMGDAICIGEGEDALLEFANALGSGRTPSDIQNLWIRENGRIQRNKVRPLIQDLDSLPFSDYRPERKFRIHGAHVRQGVSDKDFRGVYEIMTSRGCPFSCTFCCNSQLRTIYHQGQFIRRRSVSNVIRELVEAKEQTPLRYVNFYDDVFTFSKEWLREFSSEYKEHVGLPFWCYHHPNYADRETFELLKKAGVHSVTMGIQSGSDHILKEVFNRSMTKDKILSSAQILGELRIKNNIDLITNNPLEREIDCEQTLRLLLELPMPVHFNGGLSQLMVYPGTRIQELIKRQNTEERLDDRVSLFFNLLYLLCQTRLSRIRIGRFQKSRFLRRHPEILKLFLVVPWLKIDFILAIRNLIPIRLIYMLRAFRTLAP